MRRIAVAAALAAALLASGCAALAPSDLVPVAEQLDALAGVESARATELDPAVRQVVALLEPGATGHEAGAVVARFLQLTDGAEESRLLVLPLTAAAAGAQAAAVPDVAPDPRRLTVSSLVEDPRLAAAAAEAWHDAVSRYSDAAGALWNRADSGDRFSLAVEVDAGQGLDDASAVAATADGVVRILEGSGIPAAAISWQVRGDAAWLGSRALPEEALRAAVAEAAAAATAAPSPLSRPAIASVEFEAGLVTLSLALGDLPAGGAPEDVYAAATAALGVLAEHGVAAELTVRSRADVLVAYGPDGCPKPGTIAAGERPPAPAGCAG